MKNYIISAIFQCFLTAKYPITPASIKPIGMIKIPMLSIFNFLQFSNVLVHFGISDKNSYRYQNKNNSKKIPITISFFQKTYSICTKSTSDSKKYEKLFIQGVNNLVYQIYFFFFIQQNTILQGN